MSRFKVDERLERLVSSPICPAEDASKYAKEVADKVAEKSLAKRESRFFKALADENRIRMIKLLTMREMCVCELMVALDLTQPTTSHHLNILERKGLIKKRKEGKWSYYSIADSKLIEGLRDLGLLK